MSGGRWIKAALAGALGLALQSAGAHEPDPAATGEAVQLLLSMANEVIPRQSTCFGDYGQVGRARVRHLLATQLAYLYAGDNAINGGCRKDACEVIIAHVRGEDVSSAAVSFALRHGKPSLASLHCVITP